MSVLKPVNLRILLLNGIRWIRLLNICVLKQFLLPKDRKSRREVEDLFLFDKYEEPKLINGLRCFKTPSFWGI